MLMIPCALLLRSIKIKDKEMYAFKRQTADMKKKIGFVKYCFSTISTMSYGYLYLSDICMVFGVNGL